MIKVDKCGNIAITQGDSGTIKQTLWIDKNKSEIFTLSEGEYIELFVRVIAGGEPVLAKRASEQYEDGAILFYFTSQETAALARGEYIYDTALFSDDPEKKNTYAGGDVKKRTFSIV